MAVFTEDTVRVRIELVRNSLTGEPRVQVSARSIDSASGHVVRTLNRYDITDQMSAGRLTGITDLLADVEARLKALWNIP